MEEEIVTSASKVERMKRAAKKIRKANGIQHCQALDAVAIEAGYRSWQHVTVSAAAMASVAHGTNTVRPTPPIGTPTPPTRGGNSTPARSPVAGVQKSPVLGPVSGE